MHEKEMRRIAESIAAKTPVPAEAAHAPRMYRFAEAQLIYEYITGRRPWPEARTMIPELAELQRAMEEGVLKSHGACEDIG